jgi:succinylglutamate desuccinylase
VKILLLGSQHGNELLGEKLYAHILKHQPELADHVQYVVGNPEARRQRKRFIESDLNRSYNGRETTYEERRATYILDIIHEQSFDLILDLHTTTCVQPPCLIVPSIHPELARFLRACSLTRVVHINHAIAKTSLIGACPQAIAIEVNKNDVSPQLLSSLCADIHRFIKQEATHTKKQIYEVTELLAKGSFTESQAGQLVNFTRSSHGFYPILVGENSYKKHTDYLGFKADKMYEIEV